jgi:hypothetical protein
MAPRAASLRVPAAVRARWAGRLGVTIGSRLSVVAVPVTSADPWARAGWAVAAAGVLGRVDGAQVPVMEGRAGVW